ncbi:hypothetical protein Ocin01_19701 [Orchesella cincta]|uniref:Uncharacterized protein n=1 Tax=Orchesella cincta TaxID=48709 RepID=A0A1D2M241_ORCCI|nr:hypothetical protein Ocin01_19701 [Orchesella cincta]
MADPAVGTNSEIFDPARRRKEEEEKCWIWTLCCWFSSAPVDEEVVVDLGGGDVQFNESESPDKENVEVVAAPAPRPDFRSRLHVRRAAHSRVRDHARKEP